jgi:hypothetical protein
MAAVTARSAETRTPKCLREYIETSRESFWGTLSHIQGVKVNGVKWQEQSTDCHLVKSANGCDPKLLAEFGMVDSQA